MSVLFVLNRRTIAHIRAPVHNYISCNCWLRLRWSLFPEKLIFCAIVLLFINSQSWEDGWNFELYFVVWYLCYWCLLCWQLLTFVQYYISSHKAISAFLSLRREMLNYFVLVFVFVVAKLWWRMRSSCLNLVNFVSLNSFLLWLNTSM